MGTNRNWFRGPGAFKAGHGSFEPVAFARDLDEALDVLAKKPSNKRQRVSKKRPIKMPTIGFLKDD